MNTQIEIQMNSLETYEDAGRKAADAMNGRDIARYNFENSWFRRAIALERGNYKVKAQEAYNKGYKENRI